MKSEALIKDVLNFEYSIENNYCQRMFVNFFKYPQGFPQFLPVSLRFFKGLVQRLYKDFSRKFPEIPAKKVIRSKCYSSWKLHFIPSQPHSQGLSSSCPPGEGR